MDDFLAELPHLQVRVTFYQTYWRTGAEGNSEFQTEIVQEKKFDLPAPSLNVQVGQTCQRLYDEYQNDMQNDYKRFRLTKTIDCPYADELKDVIAQRLLETQPHFFQVCRGQVNISIEPTRASKMTYEQVYRPYDRFAQQISDPSRSLVSRVGRSIECLIYSLFCCWITTECNGPTGKYELDCRYQMAPMTRKQCRQMVYNEWFPFPASEFMSTMHSV